jgi:hypothetical protein
MSFFPDDVPVVSPPRPKSVTPPWMAPPTSELAVPVPVFSVLARRPGVALCLRRIDVYREGWRFAFSVRAARVEGMGDDEWFELLEHIQSRRPIRRHANPGELRIGLELPDGSRIIGNDRGWPHPLKGEPTESPHLMIRQSGGGGSDDEYDLGMYGWLWPSPPHGSLRLVVDWRALDIAEQSFAVDSNRLVAARASVLDIWAD